LSISRQTKTQLACTETDELSFYQKNKSVNCTNIWSSNRKLGKHQQGKKFMTTAFVSLSATGKCARPQHTFQGSFWIHHWSMVTD